MDEKFGNVQKKIDGIPYKAGVESFIYVLVATKANIAFAVSMVSQFMSKAGPPHWMVVKHIMRYLNGTLDFKLCLEGKDIMLRGFCNENRTGDVNDRCFIMGYVCFVGVGVILWKYNKRPTIALFMTKMEYMAISHSIKEAVWLWRMWDT